jgi:hypothetical protein
MNIKIKHLLIFLFSLLLLSSTLFIYKKVDNAKQMESIQFGYPLPFVSQDLSIYNKSFQFFPRYQKFEIGKFNEIKFFLIGNFIISFIVFFLSLEFLIHIFEIIYFKIKTEKG